MAHKLCSSLLAQVFIASILLAITVQVVAKRNFLQNPKKNDMTQPEGLLTHDHSAVFPGIGSVTVPPAFIPHLPYTGSGGGTGSNYVPDGDGNFIPNPRFEVPNPGSTGPSVSPLEHP